MPAGRSWVADGLLVGDGPTTQVFAHQRFITKLGGPAGGDHDEDDDRPQSDYHDHDDGAHADPLSPASPDDPPRYDARCRIDRLVSSTDRKTPRVPLSPKLCSRQIAHLPMRLA